MDGANPTSPVNPLAPYPPLLPTEIRSRAPEFYGFVAWTSTCLLFCFFLLWALLPDDYISWLGVTWYPSREWTLLLPAYSIILVLLTYFTYFALAFADTPGFADICTITGAFSCAAADRAGSSPYAAAAQPGAIPLMYDVPIGLVNRVMYSGRSTRSRARAVPPEYPHYDRPEDASCGASGPQR
ncbi:uncharacterized protein PHACADRAFT_139597 [Phanerochaete carnosa HHB-10118-sp]|uniref:PIG-P domain-containing protein n=1 Tax=Phanerochaete carnosa (strain HHB-10118-sp) TaxID=650164 RepID=K5W2E8_PHACS|nr:uncharacterized protein PHACADRAFT_139597 [Phanerochaete carnosa HHB-10118-sp]EKM58033.1 hypothetical protein PHACADRAFT_139597 [Phanerochaete carnosa HHB-10118-sp]